ncbi:hypothetical protein OCH239_08715 [Roseivivax halodurans JCM 10272]|uniref:DUF3306 domain-containing protein n=1 Tax=Roseivivax halodurans JCM 10272 TaxID=1449350 RepID=X7EM38_9RHOB|nr:DUF3306 domain-containing protein [Roseivivax halodurans]ETX16228.1 hypothetical protein OCH239_08715 [Roseivivax halodurans JCM 10272]
MSRSDFWSRRKAAVEAERSAEREAEETRSEEEALEAQRAEIAEKSDAEICAEFGLPDPDEMKPGDTVAGFLRKEIPERLRRRALRRLWRSNPVLACLDGLNDYDEDYTNNAIGAGGLKSAYQVGRGLKRHVDALAEAAEKRDAPENVTEKIPEETQVGENSAEEEQSVQEAGDAAPASTTMVAVESELPAGTQQDEEEWRPAPRRMRFRFDTETG